MPPMADDIAPHQVVGKIEAYQASNGYGESGFGSGEVA